MRPIATFCLLTALLLSGSILPAAASQAFPATLSSLHKEPAGQDGDDTGIDAVAGASGEKYAVPGSRGAAQSGTPGAQNATAGNAPQHADGQPDATAAGTQGKPTVVYTFPIDGDIMPAQQRLVAKCLADARSGGAELVLIRLNTYGGLVNAADSIRTMILNSPVPVWVFIDNQAASAGALIAIAAERIYMRPGGSIGAASVVDQNGKPMPDKFQSFMRATMRATAEAHGKVIERIDGDDTLWRWRRDPQVAEAMVGRTVGDSTTRRGARLHRVGSVGTPLQRRDGLHRGRSACTGRRTAVHAARIHPHAARPPAGMADEPGGAGHFRDDDRRRHLFRAANPRHRLRAGGGDPRGGALFRAALHRGCRAKLGADPLYHRAGAVGRRDFRAAGLRHRGRRGIIAVVTGLSFAAIDNDLLRHLSTGELTLAWLLRPVLVVIIAASAALVGGIVLGRRFLTGRRRCKKGGADCRRSPKRVT